MKRANGRIYQPEVLKVLLLLVFQACCPESWHVKVLLPFHAPYRLLPCITSVAEIWRQKGSWGSKALPCSTLVGNKSYFGILKLSFLFRPCFFVHTCPHGNSRRADSVVVSVLWTTEEAKNKWETNAKASDGCQRIPLCSFLALTAGHPALRST